MTDYFLANLFKTWGEAALTRENYRGKALENAGTAAMGRQYGSSALNPGGYATVVGARSQSGLYDAQRQGLLAEQQRTTLATALGALTALGAQTNQSVAQPSQSSAPVSPQPPSGAAGTTQQRIDLGNGFYGVRQ